MTTAQKWARLGLILLMLAGFVSLVARLGIMSIEVSLSIAGAVFAALLVWAWMNRRRSKRVRRQMSRGDEPTAL